MKKIVTSIALLSFSLIFSQAWNGSDDYKTSLSVDIQKGGLGLTATFETGLNDYVSCGSSFGIILNSDPVFDLFDETYYIPQDFGNDITATKSVEKQVENSKVFTEKIDFNLRFNGHLGETIGMGKMSDLYFGLRIALRNLGPQVGIIYQINDHFGFFGEGYVPIEYYYIVDGKEKNYYKFYEQPMVNLGLVFSL
jgi:hypothetical protein